MTMFRYPIGQNQLIIVKPRSRISFYTNPASCISVAVYDRLTGRAALTHTLHPVIGKPQGDTRCACSPEDYLKRLPSLAREKQDYIERNFDCILKYHSCDKAAYTDASIQYLSKHFGGGEHIEYHLIGGGSSSSKRKTKVSLREIYKHDYARLSNILNISPLSSNYICMNDLNVITALAQMIHLRLNLVYADICGDGQRMFDFYFDSGEIAYSPRTKVRNPVILRKNSMMETQIKKIIEQLVQPAPRRR